MEANINWMKGSKITVSKTDKEWVHNLAHYAFIVCISRTHAERGHVQFKKDNVAYEQGHLACNFHCGNLFWKDLWARNILTRINYIISVLWPNCGPPQA
jgi:hypothetical protein